MKSHIPKPRMPGGANRIILRRTAVLMVLFGVLVFVPLAGKLIQLQILRHEELGRMAADNQNQQYHPCPGDHLRPQYECAGGERGRGERLH